MTPQGNQSPKRDYLGFFAGIARAVYLGEIFQMDANHYRLSPALLGKYDVLRSVGNPASELDRLVKDLPAEFRSVAKSELYRKEGGWIERGSERGRLQEVELDGKPHVVPCLDGPTVGIDTSSDPSLTYVCIACFDDAARGYAYLEKHLQLPKSHDPVELKWRNLNFRYRTQVIDSLPTLLALSCRGLLLIKTSALLTPVEKISDVFIKLIDGCFSGYEHAKKERDEMRKLFFGLTNNIPMHIDPDFSPLQRDKIARFLVKSLSSDGTFIPLHAGLKSEESYPIQVADVICGAAKTMIRDKKRLGAGWSQVPFDNKLKERDAKAYCWRR